MATSAPQVPEEEEDIGGILSSRSLGREPVEELAALGRDASPPLKPKRQRVLSCLTHGESCSCLCCNEPSLAWVSIRWALVQADLQKESQNSCQLRHFAKLRCSNVTAKLHTRMSAVISSKLRPYQYPAPSLLQAESGRVHLAIVMSRLCYRAEEKGKAPALWEEIEVGLQAVECKGAMCPELVLLRAALLGAKAVSCCLALAGKKQCNPEDLFSTAWGWTPPLTLYVPKIKMQLKQQSRLKSTSCDKPFPAGGTASKSEAPLEQVSSKTKEMSAALSKKAKDPVSKISITKPSMVFKTPRATRTPGPKSFPMMKSAGIAGDMRAFDFTSEVPDIIINSTPLTSAKKTKTCRSGLTKSKGSFQVFEDCSPQPEKPVTVPAAPKRTNRSRFKV